MERCAATVPANADEDSKERTMKQCMRAKGYGLTF